MTRTVVIIIALCLNLFIALQCSSNKTIDLYSEYRGNKVQALTKTLETCYTPQDIEYEAETLSVDKFNYVDYKYLINRISKSMWLCPVFTDPLLQLKPLTVAIIALK